MQRCLLRSKIYGAKVTQSEIDYEGSITIDRDLMDAVDLVVGEKVLIANMENGARLETYVIEGSRGSGTICMNGAASHQAKVGDRIIIMSFCILEPHEIQGLKPLLVYLDENNRVKGLARA